MTQPINVLSIGGPSSGKTQCTVDSFFDHVRANPKARILIACRGKLSPFLTAAVGYIRMCYPSVTVTIQEGVGKKDTVKGVAYQYLTDWPPDSP
jgi:hypothetical protein